MILKCKMCGGDIEVNKDMTVGTCLYCGSTMTLPRIDSEKKARLFNRANQYRQSCEFDKAYRAYEAVVEEDDQEAEAYWGMVLAEYGIEYVKDPSTGKRIPTCHRTQAGYVTENTNYKLACKYADSESRLMYEDEANELDRIQKSIIAISSREEPYDVFICYKDTDDTTGERTKDSVLAQSIYDELENAGIRTFFSRISLESHLGENYEPYIYAALQSSRVMLVVSTSKENCESIWVKNEWSRFLHFMQEDINKAIIPVYQDMLPNHFPEEMSALQAQDMSKVGAIQDLVYGVKKLLGTTSHESQNVRLDALAMAFDQKEEKERKQKRTVKIIVTAVVCVVLAFFIVRGINSNMASQAKESEEQSYASPYVGRWISSDEENELILNADGTCTFNGESLYWTRDKSLLDGRFSIYVNYGSNMASRSTVANVRTVFSRDGNIRFIQVTVNNTRANPAPEALNSLIKDEKGITTIFGKAE